MILEAVGLKNDLSPFFISEPFSDQKDNPDVVKSSFSVENCHQFFSTKQFLEQEPVNLDFKSRFEVLEFQFNELKNDFEMSRDRDENLISSLSKLGQELIQFSQIVYKDKESLENIQPSAVQINELKRQLVGIKDIKQENSDESRIVYKLYMDRTYQQGDKLYELEKRIDCLEKAIGLDMLEPAASLIDQGDSSLFATSGTLIKQMERIEGQLSLLTDPVVFEQTMRRVKDASASLDRLAELKRRQRVDKVLPPTDSSDERITFLYNQMTKLDPVANLIPHLITRLHGLKELHSDTAYFAENLKLIQQTQADLQLIAAETKQGLEKLTKSLQENQTQMLLNVEKLLEKR